MSKSILLSFDTEEFDLPLEYDIPLSEEEQYKFALTGLKKIIYLLRKLEVHATFFVTASFASKYPEIIREISKKHEISSHGLRHSIKDYSEEETKESKEIIEKIIGKKIKGFRFPRLKKVDFNSLRSLGFKYDSSVSPSFMPGRYNNYFEKKKVYLKEGIYEVPTSALPILRFPLSWFSFRFFGAKYQKFATILCLRDPGFVNLYFHPWEFNELGNFKIPFYIKRNSGKKLVSLIEKYIIWCRNSGFEFKTFSQFLGIS